MCGCLARDVTEPLLTSCQHGPPCPLPPPVPQTFTMDGGSPSSPAAQGVTARSLHRLFQLVEERQRAATSVAIKLSVLELYNGSLVDLLAPAKAAAPTPGVSIRTAADGGVTITGASQHALEDAASGLTLLRQAQSRRVVGDNHINEKSSRSHLVAMVYVATRATAAAATTVTQR